MGAHSQHAERIFSGNGRGGNCGDGESLKEARRDRKWRRIGLGGQCFYLFGVLEDFSAFLLGFGAGPSVLFRILASVCFCFCGCMGLGIWFGVFLLGFGASVGFHF